MSQFGEHSEDSEGEGSGLEFSEDDYNSGDDEFLAFHDADIEAQIRAEMARLQERKRAAVVKNAETAQLADTGKIDKVSIGSASF